MRKADTVQTLRKYGNCEPQGISKFHGSITQPRKLPRSRLFQEDEYVTFKKEDTVTSLTENTKSWVKATSVKK